MTPFQCTHCQATVYFENVHCGQCGALLGFNPAQGRMLAYASSNSADATINPAAGAWYALQSSAAPPVIPATATSAAAQVPCQNRITHNLCNWMVDDAAQGHTLCRSCRLTRTIPDLTVEGNLARWARIEQAKRRLLYGLDRLGLAPQPRHAAGAGPVDAERGLCFDLLGDVPGGEPVRTGHDNGVITLNIAEADDDHREAVRVRMGEPLRTLLGHLRHEVSHYLQFRHVAGDPDRNARCREVFGDETLDYAEALQTHYQQGPAADWPSRCISAYASAHPWEDWAETCAHWLLIVDAVQTAAAWGLTMNGPVDAEAPRLDQPSQIAAQDTQALVLRQWLPVAQFLNAMNRSIGVHDSYPFLMPQPVLHKLDTVASLLGEARVESASAYTARAAAASTDLAAGDTAPAATPLNPQTHPIQLEPA